MTVWPSLASATATVPFWMTACAEGEAAGAVVAGAGVGVLFGDPAGLTGGLTVGDGLGDGEVAVAVCVGAVDTAAGGLPGEVPVGLGAVDVCDVEEHAPSRRPAHTPIVSKARWRGRCGGRRCGLLRPGSAMCGHLLGLRFGAPVGAPDSEARS